MRFPLCAVLLMGAAAASSSQPVLAQQQDAQQQSILAKTAEPIIAAGPVDPGPHAAALAHPVYVRPYLAGPGHSRSVQEGRIGTHHGRAWIYVDGYRHGFPYGKSPYLPRAAGASFNFGQWVPRRSFYYPYVPGQPEDSPYGFSPEPYYGQSDLPPVIPPGSCSP